VTDQVDRSERLLAATATALLLGLGCSSAFASNGFTIDCDQVSESLPAIAIQTPSLTLRNIDYGQTDSAADMKDPASDPTAEKITSPTLAEVADVSLTDNSESSSANEDDAAPVNNLPETALRLPGVSEEDQPRFRRRMYRTDI
jgi:hypothetical protein